MKKHVIASLLILALVLALIPAAALAEDTTQTEYAREMTVDGKDCLVGFGSYDESGLNDSCFVFQGDAIWGPGGDVRETDTGTYKYFTDVQIAAATVVPSEGGMILNRELLSKIQVNRVWLEHLSGDNDVIALAPGGARELTTGISNPVHIYALPGSSEKSEFVLLKASVTVNEETFTVAVEGCREKIVYREYTPENLAGLNAALEKIAAEIAEIKDAPNVGQRTNFRVSLDSQYTYEGKILVPDGWTQKDSCFVEICGNGATVKGGFDLNGGLINTINDIHFVAATEGTGKALYNGGAEGIIGCSFTGYDIACDSSTKQALCEFQSCTFQNNNIGIRLDYQSVDGKVSRSVCSGSKFLQNGTAVQIKSTNNILTPFYLRYSGCSFIGSTTDFDISCPGHFYFYANYYGSGTSESDCSYRVPKIRYSDENPAIAYTNPRSDKPVGAAGARLVLDAALPVSILNSEASNLPIYDGSLSGEKINILDDSEKLMGSWSFGS
jgi:hypothetical protein